MIRDFMDEAEYAFEAYMARKLADPECPIEETSWAYQEMVKKRFIKSYKKGRKQERSERLQGLRQVILSLILNRFPLTASEAQQKLEQIQNPEVLQRLIIEIAAVQTAEEARRLILEARDKK